MPAIHVQVNPDALASRGISLEDVRTALVNATTDLPKGNLEGKRQEFTLDTNDQLFDASAFRQHHRSLSQWRPGPDQGHRRRHQLVAVGAHRCLVRRQADLSSCMIERQPGANTIKVVDRIKAMMPALEASIPPSVHVDLVSDRSTNIRDFGRRR